MIKQKFLVIFCISCLGSASLTAMYQDDQEMPTASTIIESASFLQQLTSENKEIKAASTALLDLADIFNKFNQPPKSLEQLNFIIKIKETSNKGIKYLLLLIDQENNQLKDYISLVKKQKIDTPSTPNLDSTIAAADQEFFSEYNTIKSQIK